MKHEIFIATITVYCLRCQSDRILHHCKNAARHVRYRCPPAPSILV
ncbi:MULTISPECIES: IS1 family transposase [Aeromonas]|nr:hypothetical protein [Aeromonas caviae]MBA8787721.1 hypothetical protein [Aeromonas sp. TW 6]